MNPTRVGAVSIFHGDSRHLHSVVDALGVNLVITSPPYNVGLQYATYSDQREANEYYGMLSRVFQNCWEVMNEGGRICVVVPFGVNRNPWEPLASRVANILSSIGFMLRGQIVWDKGSSGNRTSWGSWRSPSDPSLRDTCEAIIVAHKETSRATLPADALDDEGYSPWLPGDLFMELAQDHWTVAPESAQRVGHPAPFPVQLAERLIRFYGWRGCRVLDPFAGSGTVGVAALKLGCEAALVELDEDYCRLAARRCKDGG
jgi:site-specific DNA-methyltransferase (adenine-specific)